MWARETVVETYVESTAAGSLSNTDGIEGECVEKSWKSVKMS